MSLSLQRKRPFDFREVLAVQYAVQPPQLAVTAIALDHAVVFIQFAAFRRDGRFKSPKKIHSLVDARSPPKALRESLIAH